MSTSTPVWSPTKNYLPGERKQFVIGNSTHPRIDRYGKAYEITACRRQVDPKSGSVRIPNGGTRRIGGRVEIDYLKY